MTCQHPTHHTLFYDNSLKPFFWCPTCGALCLIAHDTPTGPAPTEGEWWRPIRGGSECCATADSETPPPG
jgi:hypothetical protein